MPRKAAKVTRGGTRLSDVEVERRTARVAELLQAQTARADIVAVMSAEFGSAPRTVDDYIRRVRDRFAVDAATTTTDERAATVTRLEQLARELKAKRAWGPLVNVERLLIDVRGLRRGTVAVEPAGATAQALPEVSVEDAIAECFFSVESFARGWERGVFPKPSAERLERVRDGIRAAAEALGVTTAPPMPPRTPRTVRTAEQYDAE